MKKSENNLLGQIAYEMAFIAYLEGVKVSAHNNLKTLEKEFQKVWFKVQILSVNQINDEIIKKTSDEVLKLYFE